MHVVLLTFIYIHMYMYTSCAFTCMYVCMYGFVRVVSGSVQLIVCVRVLLFVLHGCMFEPLSLYVFVDSCLHVRMFACVGPSIFRSAPLRL